MHPLANPRLKLKRADQHLNVLKRHIRRLNKEHPDRIREESDPKTGQPIKSAEKPDTPLQWSLIIGDIAHNLRSALDHLAWQIAIESSPNRDPQKYRWRRSDISWPILHLRGRLFACGQATSVAAGCASSGLRYQNDRLPAVQAMDTAKRGPALAPQRALEHRQTSTAPQHRHRFAGPSDPANSDGDVRSSDRGASCRHGTAPRSYQNGRRCNHAWS